MKEECNWEQNQACFIQNKNCPAFPCHDHVPISEFNCLFCYCPLYALGSQCGGHFQFTEDGIKDCSFCSVPHRIECYADIVEKAKILVEKVRRECEANCPKGELS